MKYIKDSPENLVNQVFEKEISFGPNILNGLNETYYFDFQSKALGIVGYGVIEKF